MVIMRKLAFIISIFGIFVLVLVMFFSGEIKVEDVEDLDELEVNSKVIVDGKIVGERNFGEGVKFELDNGLFVLCDNCGVGFIGRKVEVYGAVEDVYGEKMVGVLRMVVLE